MTYQNFNWRFEIYLIGWYFVFFLRKDFEMKTFETEETNFLFNLIFTSLFLFYRFFNILCLFYSLFLFILVLFSIATLKYFAN